MKFLGKLLLWLAIAALAAVAVVYFLVQTRWGAHQVSRWISAGSDYHLTFDKMEHHFSSPSQIQLVHVAFGRRGQPDTLAAGRVDIGLSSRQLTAPLHFGALTLQDGTLNTAAPAAALPFQADALRLNNMTLTGGDLDAQQVSGSVAPWQSEADNLLGKQAQVQLSAASGTVDGVPMKNLLVQGRIDGGITTLNTLSADISRGSLSGRATRGADGSWQIDTLRLSEVRLQSDRALADFFAPLSGIPSLTIGRLEVANASLQGPDWSVTDLDLSLRNLTFSQGGWQSEDGRLSMNASEFILGGLNLTDPIVNAEFSPRGIAMRQFTTRWERGTVRASGQWLREGSALVLDDLSAAGLEYTLPDNWRQLAQQPLPAWMQNVTVNKFSTSRNLIIDINPDFPWQVTSLEGSGDGVQLARDGRWGIWRGSLALSGASATFNRVDLRRPSLKLAANSSTLNISAMNAYTGRGMLDATAVISQLPQRQATVSLNGRGVPMNILQPWGWPPLNVTGEGNLQLRASGSLQPGTAMKPTVNGELRGVNASGQTVMQVVREGQASTGGAAQ